jgi:GNAT superfamily N-acetyltransferase
MNNEDPEKKFTIQEFFENSDEQVFDLLHVVYPDHPVYKNTEMIPRYWRWWFREIPGKKGRVFGVPGDNCIAGVRPLSFFSFMVNGHEEVDGFLNATVTHPEYRKRGFFSKSLQYVLNVAGKEENLRFAISFPNDNSYPLHLKNPRIAALCDLPLYVKVLCPEKISGKIPLPMPFLKALLSMAQRAKKRMLPQEVSIQEIKQFDSRFDAFWKKVKHLNKAWMQRTTEYLNWRYVQSPLGRYSIFAAVDQNEGSIRGYIVTKDEMRFGLKLGLILDLVVLPEELNSATILVNRGIERLEQQGVDVIGCLMLRHHPLVRALRENGLLHVPGRFAPRKFYVTISKLTDDQQFNAFICNPENWFLMWGDTDTV